MAWIATIQLLDTVKPFEYGTSPLFRSTLNFKEMVYQNKQKSVVSTEGAQNLNLFRIRMVERVWLMVQTIQNWIIQN